MAWIYRVKSKNLWRVRALRGQVEQYVKDLETAKRLAKEWDEAWPGWPLQDGKRRTQKEKDRIAKAVHEYNEEHGWGGVPLFAKEHNINERTLSRWIRDWRKRQGIVTKQMKAREKVLNDARS